MTARRRETAQILHVDDDLLIVDKPPHTLLSVSLGDELSVPELVSLAPPLTENEPFLVTHKLPEQASGALLYARHQHAHDAVNAQINADALRIDYTLLVSGFVPEQDAIELPIWFNKRLGKPVASERRGTPARTEYRVVQRIAGHTVVEAHPLRERFAQVQAHFAGIGHPLTIDPQFGGGTAVYLSSYKLGYRPSGRREERPLIDRLTMHATRITLTHPTTNQRLTVESPLPKDFRATIKQLERLV